MFLTPGGQCLLLLRLIDTLLTFLINTFFWEFEQLSAKFRFLDSSNHIA